MKIKIRINAFGDSTPVLFCDVCGEVVFPNRIPEQKHGQFIWIDKPDGSEFGIVHEGECSTGIVDEQKISVDTVRYIFGGVIAEYIEAPVSGPDSPSISVHIMRGSAADELGKLFGDLFKELNRKPEPEEKPEPEPGKPH